MAYTIDDLTNKALEVAAKKRDSNDKKAIMQASSAQAAADLAAYDAAEQLSDTAIDELEAIAEDIKGQ